MWRAALRLGWRRHTNPSVWPALRTDPRHRNRRVHADGYAGACEAPVRRLYGATHSSVAQIPLSGANSIVGRAVVVHELQDDLGKGDHSQPGTQGKTSKTTGNAGECPHIVQLRCSH